MTYVSEHLRHGLKQLHHNLASCILGKSNEIDLLIVALLAGGHVLIEDVPGTGKTVFVKSLAKSIDGLFRRIQCNPDLLPSDITGVSIYHPKDEEFIFRPGPIMTNILLVDEINRATTKTQSALLEAMEERHITVDGTKYELPRPFLLLATQNPIDFEGTYTLPEAQLDRFMIKLSLGYPDHSTELQMVKSQSRAHPVDTIQPIMDHQQLLFMQQQVKEIHIDDAVIIYIIDIVRNTREHAAIFLGSSPRATMQFVQAVKAYAYLQEREFVIPDDVKYIAPYVLAHRMLLHTETQMSGDTMYTILKSLINQVVVPVRMEN